MIEEHLAFYGFYHQHPGNILIHMIFVPMLWFSGCLVIRYFSKTLATLIFLMYAGTYVYLGGKAGMIASGVYLLLFLLADYLTENTTLKKKIGTQQKPTAAAVGDKRVLYIALVCHLLGWFMQIVPGHWYLEGRKPALMDSLFQALTFAPLFVFYEIVWYFNPDDELHIEVMKRINELNHHQ